MSLSEKPKPHNNMNTIQLTDSEARISSITETNGITTVELEWGGPSDRSIDHFDIAKLGEVTGHGGNLCGGWAVLYGACLLNEGDTIPYIASNEEEGK